MRQLYVCSKPMLSPDGSLHRHLIGILSHTEEDGYQFEYRLDTSPQCAGLILPIFPDINTIYTDTATRVLLNDYLPSETDTLFMSEILKKTGLQEYDEWEWLKTFESDDPEAETCLYDKLPEDVIRHDTTIHELTNTQFDDIVEDEALFDNGSDTENEIDEFDAFILGNEYFNNDFEKDTDDEINPDNLNLSDTTIEQLDAEIGKTTTIHAKKIQPSALLKPSSPVIQPQTPKLRKTVIQKTVKTQKRNIQPGDFIEAPPESPMDIIEQRLLENQKKRQQALSEALKQNPYKNN